MRRRPELLQAALATLDAASRRRRQRVVQQHVVTAAGQRVLVDGRWLINFCSNDYLGLTRHPELARVQQQATAEFGSGSGAAHLVTGHSREHHLLEQELAEFTGRERALLFSTGYMANLGVISSFAARGEIVLQDRLNHASLLDAARLSGARNLRYTHADAQAAGTVLQQQDRISVLATDAVFSMDGDLAPLHRLAEFCRARDVWLLADDAHGFGVLGETGAGTLQQLQLDAHAVPLLMATLGKALGCFGAFVAGDADVIELLMQRARSYVYTTAPPPALAAAARAALRLCRTEDWRRMQLHRQIARFRAGAVERGLTLMPSHTAIQPLLLGDSRRALQWSTALEQAGFWVSAIRPPTVPAGSARLRIALSAVHSDSEVDALLDTLAGLHTDE